MKLDWSHLIGEMIEHPIIVNQLFFPGNTLSLEFGPQNTIEQRMVRGYICDPITPFNKLVISRITIITAGVT